MTAVASGLLLVPAFPPYGWWPLAPLSVALLTIVLRGQRLRSAAWLGLLHGVAFFLPLLSWTNMQVGRLPWIVLSVTEASYLVVLAVGTAAAIRWLSPALLPWACGVLWVGQETLRGTVPYGGFPWGRLAFSQADGPYLGLAALGGPSAMSFAVAVTGGALAWLLPMLVRTARGRPEAAGTTAAGTTMAGIAAVGIAAVATLVGPLMPGPPTASATATVAVVQGNVPRLGLDFTAQRRAVLDNHVAATEDLAARVATGEVPQPELVVWPENSSDIDPFLNDDAGAVIQRAADTIGVPILVGALLRGPGDGVTNAGLVWRPQGVDEGGPGESYAKRHPVPFAENIPMRPLVRLFVPNIDELQPHPFVPGDQPGVLRIGRITVGDVICFEIAYDSLVRDTVNGGAQLIVVQTNNATFGFSAESAQQLAMVRIRAVEHGRAAVMASTSGTSAIVTAEGTVVESTALFTQTVLVRDIGLSGGRTLATSAGEWPTALGSAGALAVFVAAALRARRARPTQTRHELEDV